MRITQGTFSFLPDLSDEQIAAQIAYALRNGWSISVEHTDDPHPRNALWEMWGQPLFDLARARRRGRHATRCASAREAYPHAYVKVVCYDRSLGRQTTALSFIVGRPPDEPGLPRSSARRRPTGRSATRCTPTRPTRRGGATARRARIMTASTRRADRVDDRAADVVRAVLDELDRELVALAPVKTRIREIAALLVIDRLREDVGLRSSARRCTCASPATRARARRRSRCGWPRSCTGSATSRRRAWSR